MIKLINKKLLKSRFYSTYYFLRTKDVLHQNNVHNVSLMQWKTNSPCQYMVAGIEEILLVLKTCLTKKQLKSLEIKYAPEGSIVKENQCAFSIKGDYSLICDLENIIDGILARRCSVATNCHKILQLIKPEQLVFMSDRSDDYRLHPYDGYSAYVAGINQFSNDSHIALIKDKSNIQVFGSMPHALIHQFNGDIVKTLKAYEKIASFDGNVLVDFDNDIIKTLKELKPHFNIIKGIRIDTSINMVDKSLANVKPKQYGVTPKLVKLVRKFLDENNGKHIKIIVSSNNNYDSIKNHLQNKSPIDFYGIGTYLTSLSLHFTADLVELNGKEFAKVGRKKLDESNLQLFRI